MYECVKIFEVDPYWGCKQTLFPQIESGQSLLHYAITPIFLFHIDKGVVGESNMSVT